MAKRYSKKSREITAGYLFLLPNIIGFILFTLFPVSASMVLSFFTWDLVSTPSFSGLSNFRAILFNDPLFWRVVGQTLYFCLLSIPIGMFLSLILALGVNQPLRGKVIFRFLFFLPVVMSAVSVSVIWNWLFNKEFGFINYVLSSIGINPISWLVNPVWAMPAIAIVAVWHGVGYNMVLFLAGLQGIPRQLYEAAELDGANAFRRFFHITIPLLIPAIFFILVMSVITSFQVFDYVFIMTGGGPFDSTRTVVTYIYELGFERFRMGYASAVAWTLFLIIFAVTLVQFRLQKKLTDHI